MVVRSVCSSCGRRQVESVAVQIRQKAATLAIVRVRNGVSGFGALARDLADSRHGEPLSVELEKESRALYQGRHSAASPDAK